MNKSPVTYGRFQPRKWQTSNTSAAKSLYRWLAVVALSVSAAGVFAKDLTWDAGSLGANNGPAVVPADGNWDTSTLNWNNGTADVAWTQTSTTSGTTGAIFGGTDGNYTVTTTAQVAATNILFNNSGYSLTGSGIYVNTFGLDVAAGKTATIGCNIANCGILLVNAGSSLNITNTMAAGNSPEFMGPGTVNITSPVAFSSNVTIDDANVIYNSSSTWTLGNSASSLQIGNANGKNYGGITASGSAAAGSLTINGGTLDQHQNKIIIARTGATGALTLNNGIINFWTSGSGANSIIAVCNNEANAGDHASLNVNGGTLNVGAPGATGAQIQMMSGGSSPGQTALFNQTGGTVLAYGEIMFGGSSGTYSGGLAALTNSGGGLYVGQYGINFGTGGHPGTNYITLSGGTVGALASWSSTIPMTLGTLNGNITFQCADNNNSPYNISLSGALTGPGGFFVTGGGTLTMSGTNNYSGSTVVSNGTLALLTSPVALVSGPVTLDGSLGSPTLALQSAPGQYWSMGALTFQNGTTALTHNFGSLTPSPSVAPIQVAGNLAFASTPAVTINGSAIPTGTFPLITYTGTLSGTLPTSVTINLTGGSAAGHIVDLTATKTIALVVTQSTFSPYLAWAVGGGLWDKTTQNWKQNGTPVVYADGVPVLFDDTASGTSPIIVTNNIIINPLSVSANNLAKSYIITGKGSITGAGELTLSGGGTVTLTETNTYSGGTLLSAGQLNVNNGGDSSGLNSAIGTGALTISGGTAVDNTSGSNVILMASIFENWNGNFSYLGSANNFNTGMGAIELTNGNVVLTVVSNVLEVDGSIGDNGANYSLTKQGNGTLTLAGNNSFGGGFELSGGQVNLGNSYAFGSGICKINGGAIDNSSGGPLTMFPASYTWNANFSYLGTSTNLDLGPGQVVCPNPLNLVVDVVSNTLITEGDIIPGNNTIHKTGLGTWDIAGNGTGAQNLNLSVDQGTVLLDKTSGHAIAGTVGLLVQSNSLAFETAVAGSQFGTTSPLNLSSGGTMDLNGISETVASFVNSNGILRNSAVGGTSTLTVGATTILLATLTGTNCVFDVPDFNGVLNLNANVVGSGSLVKSGAGLLDLQGTNDYAGDTTINAGSLELNAPDLATNSTVTIRNNGVLNLNFVNNDTNQIGALVLNGVSQPPGYYSAATITNITGTGTLYVVPPPTVNPLPGPLQFSLSGATLALSWPTNLGWILQSQTNALSIGLVGNSNAWSDVAGSAAITATNVVINPTNAAVFFRLRHP